jgi:hypothetical protein
MPRLPTWPGRTGPLGLPPGVQHSMQANPPVDDRWSVVRLSGTFSRGLSSRTNSGDVVRDKQSLNTEPQSRREHDAPT